MSQPVLLSVFYLAVVN